MKKTKLLILISAVLVLATLLCSCGGLKEAKPNKVLTGKYEDETKLLNSANEVDFGKAEMVNNSGKFVYLIDNSGENTKWIVYNLESGTTVYTYTATETTLQTAADFYMTEEPEVGLFAVTIRTKKDLDSTPTYVTELYDEKGTKIATANGAGAEISAQLNLFLFDGKCYRVAADKTIAEITTWNDLTGEKLLENLIDMSENYYYARISASSSTGDSIVMYHPDLTYATAYTFPSYAEDTTCGVLADGRLFLQYSVKQPDDAQKYDYLTANAEKYNLVTEVFDVKKEKATSLKMDYKVAMLLSRDLISYENSFDAFSDKINVVAAAYEIKDGRVDESSTAVKFISLTQKGKLQYSLSDMFPGMVAMLMPVAENLYVYNTVDGAKYLANKDGKVLGNISGSLKMNNKYIMGENKLYNLDLTVALDFKAQNLEYRKEDGEILYTNDGVFFEKNDGSTYIYNGELTEVITSADTAILNVQDSYFTIRKIPASGSVYQYYASNGNLLLQTSNNLSKIASYDGVYLFAGTKDGATIYYRFAAQA